MGAGFRLPEQSLSQQGDKKALVFAAQKQGRKETRSRTAVWLNSVTSTQGAAEETCVHSEGVDLALEQQLLPHTLGHKDVWNAPSGSTVSNPWRPPTVIHLLTSTALLWLEVWQRGERWAEAPGPLAAVDLLPS